MTTNLKGLALRWGPAIIMMLLIFAASGTPGNDIPNFGALDFTLKKGGHMTGYALLGIAYLHGLTFRQKTRARRQQLLFAVVLAFLYAVTDETHQVFTPLRTPSAIDVGIDTLGAAVGISLWTIVRRQRDERVPGVESSRQ